ncbi:hypothetical protein AWB78_07169 [Caballeronia calidae]|uniref:Uncharacterized protein n=1 Tax=Caballeronia calidae TaxID=1777139 RepID=A0A158EDB3_9BURK|nr:hypothetical protein [Caballeronia calidae]SAL04865.1 hypothetical protein AWB78_07169 [Caballeronia calidae]
MTTAERLLDLLPEVFRTRDATAAAEIAARLGFPVPALDGTPEGPLTSLLAIMGQTFDMLEAEVDNLYDDLFIETCASWLVPYIGELVGARIVDAGDLESARRQVAGTIAARRAKGTARALALRSGAIMTAPTEAVEYFRHVVTTLHLDYPEDNRPMSAALNGRAGRRAQLPDFIGQHTVELREMSEGGRFAVPNIGVRTWTTRSFPHAKTTPRPVLSVGPGHFSFSPTGADTTLWLWRAGLGDPTEATRLGLDEMPTPIPLIDAVDHPDAYYDDGPDEDKSVAVHIDGVLQRLDAICFCDLSDAPGGGWNRHGDLAARERIHIDPMRGRLRLPDAKIATPAEQIRLKYHYGAAVTTGGGGYASPAPFETDVPELPGPDPVPVTVPSATTRDAVAAALAAALDSAAGRCEIRIDDGGITELPAATALPGDAQLRLCADTCTWPTLVASAAGWQVTGGSGSILVLRGLRLIGGPLVIDTEGLEKLRLIDCTLLPGLLLSAQGQPMHPGDATLVLRQAGIEVEATRCTIGRVVMEETAQLTLVDCLIDAAAPGAFALSGPADSAGGILTADRSTLIGRVFLRAIGEVSDCLFARRPDSPDDVTVRVAHVQEGCARYSAFPEGAVVPGRYHCYPVHATDAARSPEFAAVSPAEAGYGRLLPSSPPEILAGAQGGREMGVTNATSWTRKRMLLARDLPDWTPFAMQTGIELMN